MAIARGPHGSYVPGSGRGDVTGRAYLATFDEKQRRDEALTRTKRALADEPVVLVEAPGGRVYAIPRAAHDALIALVEDRLARGEVR